MPNTILIKVAVNYKDIDKIEAIRAKYKERIKYNAHNMGDFGEFIRVKYAENIIDDLILELIKDIDITTEK